MRPARILGSHSMAVWIAITVLVTATLVLAAAGCGGGDTTTTAAPTTTQAPGTTATSEPATTTAPPTTSAPITTTPTTAGSTTTTSASGPTTTEQLSSAETRLPDGTIKGMGYIDKVWVKDGVRYLSIDYAEMLSGEEAKQAAIEDGLIKPGEDLDNDYYIRNQNPKKREFTRRGRRHHRHADARGRLRPARHLGGVPELLGPEAGRGRQPPQGHALVDHP